MLFSFNYAMMSAFSVSMNITLRLFFELWNIYVELIGSKQKEVKDKYYGFSTNFVKSKQNNSILFEEGMRITVDDAIKAVTSTVFCF